MGKRIVVLLLAFLLCLAVLPGCSAYVSHYKAVGFAHSQGKQKASMSFHMFEGTMVFKLKSDRMGRQIGYQAELETGNLKVYYDYDGIKTELFTLTDGQNVDASGGQLPEGKFYLIVETDGACIDGALHFWIE